MADDPLNAALSPIVSLAVKAVVMQNNYDLSREVRIT